MSNKLITMFEDGSLPQYYQQFFPPNCKCPECNSDLCSSANGAKVYCPNQDCQIKVAARMEECLTQLNIKGYTRDGIKKYCTDIRMQHMFEDILTNDDPSNKPVQAIKSMLKNKAHTYRELIKIMAIPKYSNRLSRLFKGMNTIDQVVNRINQYNTIEEFIATTLKRNITESIQAMAEAFDYHLNDIVTLLTSVPIRSCGLEYDIMITGNIAPIKVGGRVFVTKDDFIDLCNIVGNGKVTTMQTTLQDETDYIICDTKGSQTVKAQKGRQYGILLTSTQFLDIIKERRDNERN